MKAQDKIEVLDDNWEIIGTSFLKEWWKIEERPEQE
jgi:hypothetical protein